jgi:hypothetical protein
MLERVAGAQERVGAIERPVAAMPGVSLSASRVFRAHLCIIALLVTLHLALAFVHFRFDRLETALRFFWLSTEGNVPSLFSAGALMAAGLAALLLARSDGPSNRFAWQLAGLILLFMAVDEAASIHERIRYLTPDRQARLIWVPIYSAILLAPALYLARFWLRLPADTRWLLALGALLFLAGAVGIELQEHLHRQADVVDWLNPPLVLSVTIEELLEMLGVAVILMALLRHLAALRAGPLVIAFRT